MWIGFVAAQSQDSPAEESASEMNAAAQTEPTPAASPPPDVLLDVPYVYPLSRMRLTQEMRGKAQ